jgi:hypothetical protein
VDKNVSKDAKGAEAALGEVDKGAFSAEICIGHAHKDNCTRLSRCQRIAGSKMAGETTPSMSMGRDTSFEGNEWQGRLPGMM